MAERVCCIHDTYEKEITRGYANFPASTREQWRDRSIPLHQKMVYVNEKHAYSITPFVRVYRTLLIGGEMIGSNMSKHSHRSATVGVTVRAFAADRSPTRQYLWGQVQFFFSHDYLTLPMLDGANARQEASVPQTHYFAVMKYYPNLKPHQMDTLLVEATYDS
jgi:hypothetical protein